MVMLGVGFIIEQPPQHKGASAELPWGLEPTGTLRLQEFCACDWLATNLRMLGGRDKIAASRGVRSCPLVGIWQYGCFGGGIFNWRWKTRVHALWMVIICHYILQHHIISSGFYCQKLTRSLVGFSFLISSIKSILKI